MDDWRLFFHELIWVVYILLNEDSICMNVTDFIIDAIIRLPLDVQAI